MWWRIELDKSGAILSCDYVAEPSKVGRLVTYVQAETKAQACSYAKRWYEREKERTNANKKRLNSERIAAGLCLNCKSPAVTGRRRCKRHLEWYSDHAKKWKRGEIAPRTPADPTEQLKAQRRRQLESNHRMGGTCNITWNRLLRVFDEKGPVQFRAWIIGKITTRAAKRDHQESLGKAAE